MSSQSKKQETEDQISSGEATLAEDEQQEFICDGLWSSCFTSFQEFYASGLLCDVEINCHRTVLASASPYFRAMFSCNLAEKALYSITIHDIDPDSFRKLIDFIYTGRITVTVQNVQSLLFTASVLQINHVCQFCCKFLSGHLNPANCLEIRNLAECHNHLVLVRAADNFILEHFIDVAKQDSFNLSSKTNVKTWFSSDFLKVASEQQVYDAAMSWLKYDIDRGREFMFDVLSCVRFPLLQPEFIIHIVEKDAMIRRSHSCRDLLDEAKNYHLSIKCCLPIVTSQRMVPRKALVGVMFCIGGRGATGDPFRSIEVYDPRNNYWFNIAELKIKRRHVGVCSLGNKVFAIGGHDGKKHHDSCEMFDPATNKWTLLQSMTTCRRGIAMATLGGVLYAIGGLDDTTCFSDAERYNPETNEWSTICSMTSHRGGVGLVALNGYLFAIGGNDGVSSLDTCEKYDPYFDKWVAVSKMVSKRAGSGVTSYCGYIYACGGFDDNTPLNSVERYDPIHDCWEIRRSMLCCRGGVGMATLGNYLYAVGGHDGSNYLSSVEKYDTESDLWSQSCPIKTSRAGAGVVVCDISIDSLKLLNDDDVANVSNQVL